VSGAFVAGNDAGRAYNTFPTMNGQWIPDEYWSFPGIRNAFESTAAVQLHHRVLALSSAAGVTGLWLAGRRLPLPTPVKVALHGVAGITAAQVRVLGFGVLVQFRGFLGLPWNQAGGGRRYSCRWVCLWSVERVWRGEGRVNLARVGSFQE
jgi:hypothetical protein